MENEEFVREMLAGLAVDTDETPAPSPASATAALAAARRDEADRKRRERAEKKRDGIPDGRVVDAAIAAGLAEVFSKGDAAGKILLRQTVNGFVFDGRKVLAYAKRNLVARGVSNQAAALALEAKLFPGARAARLPSA